MTGSLQLVGLGVRCELEEQGRDGSLDFGLVEFATTAAGNRIELVADRGWGQKLNRAALDRGVSPWEHVTVDSIVQTIRTVLLPDDLGPDADDDHHWAWLVELCTVHQIVTSRDELRALPYVVEFGPALAARIGVESTTIDWES